MMYLVSYIFIMHGAMQIHHCGRALGGIHLLTYDIFDILF
jgi:hypothetical protein